ncbi:endonuclease exonuclease phosphatase family [Chlorella sorokiniana]|uniref:Endonuclease exonuclease phosphatase family n=1 Tax=Chlorella sorokiniana TaxID=3076 RepID=A0A2P6TDK7_CHLSO|nr:endonuclease exonuclease phosphatase family [Chlorella sorokiniana]|eukprot:PRW20733.1 endonuclease exonuclease phosphatase family [Chlorella sorokiniana]
MPSAQADTRATFSVATFNLRGVMDRWQERQPLLRQCLHQMDADVLCFQECLTGEFGQERRLLPPWYHVFPCKAALFNLARSGGVLRWYSHTVERLLEVAPLRRFMVQLPPAVESWREQLRLKGGLFRTIRDLAMAPFFGNSVACRIAEAHEINHSTLVLGDWRAAQRIEFYIGRNGEGVEWQGGSGEEDEVVVVPPGLSPRGSSWRSRRNGGGSRRRRNGSNGAGEGAGAGAAGGGVGGSTSGELLAAESGTSISPAASQAGSEASTDGERSVVTGGLGGFKVYVVNAHLDHASAENRQRQALAVCDWMDKEKADCAAIILCGDFNGPPQEPFHAVLRRLGYSSAYKSVHGSEPPGTWPTGIQAPLMDEGDFECLDYVYVWSAPGYDVKVLSADVYGLQPAAHDKTLFPSDHAAVKATLEVSRKEVVADLQAAQQSMQQQRRRQQQKGPVW